MAPRARQAGPWSRYDDARTAVVRDILRTVISALAAQVGRARLDILDAGGGTAGSPCHWRAWATT